MRYTLGLDIGTTSIGWAIVESDNEGVRRKLNAAGVRLFPDGCEPGPGKSTSLAVGRREKRAARRRRDRYIQRRTQLLQLLVAHGLMPQEKAARRELEAHNPYQVRALALDMPIPLHQLGRAIFHLNQRRGFKSNRIADGANEETGMIAQATSRLRNAMVDDSARTLGEFLWKRLSRGQSVRIRMTELGDDQDNSKASDEGYAFYPDRDLLEFEFTKIWQAQAPHFKEVLTDKLRDLLFECIFYQRPLKKPKVGLCTLLGGETMEPRLPKADPYFQKRRILEEINSLRLEYGPGHTPLPLNLEQRDMLMKALTDRQKGGGRQLTFTQMRRVLKLPDVVFNHERKGETGVKCDEVSGVLAHTNCFGDVWWALSEERQREVVARLLEEQDEEALTQWLQSEFDLSENAASTAALARLPQGYGRLGETATRAINRELKDTLIGDRVIVYSEAVNAAPELRHHSDFRTGEIMDELPYYGKVLERQIIPGSGDPGDAEQDCIGKISNPTVHIGLNQLRRVVNRLIKSYGHPDAIVVEIARDLKMSEKQKADFKKRQRRDREEAIRRGEKLTELGQANTGANRALLKLWEELNPDDALNRRCIYSGDVISPAMLFDGSVDIDHILPWSKTLDDSNANKILCTSVANKWKRNRTPYEAWAAHPETWAAITGRLAAVPALSGKAWRFGPDAMERFKDVGGFLARHLVDTQYLSRMAKQYLEVIAPERVYVSTGHLTGMLRRHWGLNDLLPDHNLVQTAHEKNRLDHRHHAVDAAIVSTLNLSLLQLVSSEAGRREGQGLDDVIGSVPPPWESFREELRDALDRTIVSHKPDHGTIGRRKNGEDQTAGGLHNDTAYGLTGEKDAKGKDLVVHRVPLSALKKTHFETGGAYVRDEALRIALWEETKDVSDKDLLQALRAFSRRHPVFKGIRAARVIEPLSVIPITDQAGNAYKGYKGDANYRYDVWELPNSRWKAEVVTMFDAHRKDWRSAVKQAFPTARKVLRLHQGDMVAYDDEVHGSGIGRVVKFRQSGGITLAPHNEGGALKSRDADPDDPFKYFEASPTRLKAASARQVRIDEIGRVFDPHRVKRS